MQDMAFLFLRLKQAYYYSNATFRNRGRTAEQEAQMTSYKHSPQRELVFL